MIPAWIEATQEVEIPTGLDVDAALHRALELRDRLRGTSSQASFPIDPESVETLHALCTLLDQPGSDPKVLLADASAAYEFISTVDWPSDEFGGRDDILSRLAFLCWRHARRADVAVAESKWRTAHSAIENASIRLGAKRTLATPMEQRLERSVELNLEDAEQLLSICTLLWEMCEAAPASARNEAVFFCAFLETKRLGRSDEYEYYLGEFALIAGTACRFLALRDESRRWFDLAEANFVLSHNASAHLARLAYQRLVLNLEERDFGPVLALAPKWVECFQRMDLSEDALKCRFLVAQALKETEQLETAKRAFALIKEGAKAQGLDRLAAIAGQNLFQIHAFLGQPEEAVIEAREAGVILGRLNNRVNLAKLQLGVGYLMRGQRRIGEALEAFREAQRQFSELEMSADVAAAHLILADVLLDAGQPAKAEWEIRAALPIIDELKLVPEGIAALSLLRDSLRRRQIDRRALRSLNGFFEELGS